MWGLVSNQPRIYECVCAAHSIRDNPLLMAYRQAGAVGNGLHQVLQVREYMGVGLVAVLGYQVAVNNNVKLAVRAGSELEGRNLFTGPAQGFTCHPGSAQGMASILAVENLQFQLAFGCHFPPPQRLKCRGIIGGRPRYVNYWWVGKQGNRIWIAGCPSFLPSQERRNYGRNYDCLSNAIVLAGQMAAFC